jgi:hypothetical protein
MNSDNSQPSGAMTLSSLDESHLEKIPTGSSHASDSRYNFVLPSRKLSHESFERASHVESTRASLYPITSYPSRMGNVGGVDEEEDGESGGNSDKDPDLVEWDGPNDPANPYNWYLILVI